MRNKNITVAAILFWIKAVVPYVMFLITYFRKKIQPQVFIRLRLEPRNLATETRNCKEKIQCIENTTVWTFTDSVASHLA